MVAIPEGFELVSNPPSIPEGFEVVSQQSEQTSQPIMAGRRGRRTQRKSNTESLLQRIEAGELSAQDLSDEEFGRVERLRMSQVPEISQAGIKSIAPEAGLGTAMLGLTTFDPQEFAQILKAQYPNIGIQSQPSGEVFAFNPETQQRVSLNRPGLSPMDVLQGLGVMSAFAGPAAAASAAPQAAGRLIGQQVAAPTAVRALAQSGAAGLTEAGIQQAQAMSGGEFDPEEVALAAGLAGASELLVPAAQAVGRRFGQSQLDRSVDKALQEAAPSIEQLKTKGRSIYKEIDDSGAALKVQSFDDFVDSMSGRLKKEGFDPGLHPKAAAVLNRLDSEKGKIKQITEIDTLRRVAQSAASSIEPDEKRIGGIILEKFDDYLDNLKTDDFFGREVSGIGAKYKEARNVWGKARRSELIQEALEKAKDQASGFENGMRIQFRSILNNKKKSKFFNKEEIAAMKKVVRGTPMANSAKFLGRFGINEQQATSMLGASIGVGGGASIGSAIGGTAGAGVGAVLVPAVGQVSKSLAQKLTKNNAIMADQIIRAGKDGRKVVQAYFRNVPESKRNTAELTQLLMQPNVSLDSIPVDGKGAMNTKLVKDAVHLVKTLDDAELNQLLGIVPASAQTLRADEEQK